MFLKKFRPAHSKNRMKKEGDVANARERFFSTQNKILYHLIKQRFSWMNDWIRSDDTKIVELGSGPGLSKEFITNKNILLTDVTKDYPWIDRKVDVTTDLNVFEYNSLDVVIACHVLHHIPYPKALIEQIGMRLRSGGYLLIQDTYTSILFKIILRIMKHEGYDETVDVNNIEACCNDPNDPWSANCAISRCLFEGEKNFAKMKLVKFKVNTCFLLLLSGGTIAQTWYPRWVGERGVSFIKKVDDILTRIAPRLFACECSVVLKKM